MIPKIIHQTFKVKHPLPELYRYCQSKLLSLHPDFEYKFWTDEDMFNEINTYFPSYYEEFMALPRMIMRIDMFRYFLMYKYGGMYVDMDYIMFKPFDMLDTDAKIILPAARDPTFENAVRLGMTYYIGNCIFASEPNHPFWKMTIDTLFTEKREKFQLTNDVSDEIEHVVGACGPAFLYRIMKKWIKENPESYSDIYIPPRYMFHPPTNRDRAFIEKLQREKKNYGMHLSTGTWCHNKL